MSLDYPLYEEMRRRGSRAAGWWRAGDLLYYLGLLTAMAAVPLGAAHALWSGRPFVLLWYALALVAGALTFLGGSLLKSYSYGIAEREGIDTSRY